MNAITQQKKEKWWQIKGLKRKDYGWLALLILLLGMFFKDGGIIDHLLSIFFLICLIIYLAKTEGLIKKYEGKN